MKHLIAFLIISFSFNALANQIVASRVKVINPHVFPHHGVFVFYAKVDTGTLPECSGENRWAIKTDAKGASEMISMIISAKIANQEVTVFGDGQCDSSNFGYKINYVLLN